MQGGKEKRAVEKPLLTTEHRHQRKEWAACHFEKLQSTSTPVAFLDEKWFYTTSRRRRIKHLPKGQHEEVEPTYVLPKIRSRRYPVKVMFLGVVACPNRDHNFDGRVFLKRVSKVEIVQRISRNQQFSENVYLNDAIKRGAWRELLIDILRVDEALNLIAGYYDLDEFVSERLELSYHTYTGNGAAEKKRVVIKNDQVLSNLGF